MISFENMKFVIYILVPEYITASIVDIINPRHKYYQLMFILRCVIYSIITNVIIKLLIFNFKIDDNIFTIVLLIIVSVLVGFALGLLDYNNCLYKLLRKVGIPIKSNIETAWDYIFNKHECGYVIVTLSNNIEIKGWMGEDSFASDAECGCDLFLEDVYYKNGKNEWAHDDESKGVYIAKDNIKYIEFKGGKNG